MAVSYAAEGANVVLAELVPERAQRIADEITAAAASRWSRRRPSRRDHRLLLEQLHAGGGRRAVDGHAVGMRRVCRSPRFLHPGDVVEVEVDGSERSRTRSLRRPDDRATNEK
jgi:2-keto-4-pentenoate hydratase/2-oxohepta-3-ene-1,7-dioic acid hydratase in catechol pathway